MFNSLPRTRTDKVTIEVRSNNISVVDLSTGEIVNFDIIQVEYNKKYWVEFAMELKPLAIKTILISENKFDLTLDSYVLRETLLDAASSEKLLLRNTYLELRIDFNTSSN